MLWITARTCALGSAPEIHWPTTIAPKRWKKRTVLNFRPQTLNHIGGRKGRRCSYAVTSLQPQSLTPLHRDKSFHKFLVSSASLKPNPNVLSEKGAGTEGEHAKPRGAVLRHSSTGLAGRRAGEEGGNRDGSRARFSAAEERAKLAEHVSSMAGILEGGKTRGKGGELGGGMMHGWVTTEGILSKGACACVDTCAWQCWRLF
jgi:hypothetical protein